MKKLNTRGFAHFAMLAIIVVGVAAIGTFMLVRSHAASYATNPFATAQYCPDSSSRERLTVRAGNTGNCVKALQWGLNHLVAIGFVNGQQVTHTKSYGLTVSGQFNSATKAAVENFQSRMSNSGRCYAVDNATQAHVTIAVDGIVGPVIWQMLRVSQATNPSYHIKYNWGCTTTGSYMPW